MRLRKRIVVGAMVGCLAATAPHARAQDSGRVGVTTGYPASVGILWHVTNRVALRPEFSFTVTDSSSASLVDAETNFSSFGTGITAIFYSHERDNLRLYAGPRFQYSRTRGDSDITKSTTNGYTFGGMFGGHYALGRRFAAFGELGAVYERQSGSLVTAISPGGIRTTSAAHSFGTRTGVGVVLYF